MTEIEMMIEPDEAIEMETEEVIQNGGGGGTLDYNMLQHLPQVNGVTLKGNKTLQELGITQAIGTEVDTYVQEHKEELRGLPGEPGERGPQGIPGPAGSPGATGPAGEPGTTVYRKLEDKPSINGIELVGDVSTGNKTFTANVVGTRLIMSVVDDGNEVTY